MQFASARQQMVSRNLFYFSQIQKQIFLKACQGASIFYEKAAGILIAVGKNAAAHSGISKKVTHLVPGEKVGSKLKKAAELGIAILDEQQFLRLIG
jgi:DNA ligase (NAD+)